MASTAIVTGASAGIGREYARALAARGHDLVLVARRVDRLRELAGELAAVGDAAVEVLEADLRSDAGVHRVAQRAGGDDVAVLINNAGINGYAPVAEAVPEVLEAVVRLNLLAPVLLTRAALPGLLRRDRGAVVSVASLLAFSGTLDNPRLPRRATYAGTKAALVAFTQLVAGEVTGTGVRVQVVCPGYTATEFHLTNASAPVAEDQVRGLGEQPNAMRAADVVAASLRALDAGEVVCVPALEDPAALTELARAQTSLMGLARASALATRYRD